MRAHEIRELTDQELVKALEDSHRELLNLHFRLATKQLTNTSQIRRAKKNTARLNTIVHERQLGGT
jgi:large subunit ribosomal protein L29